MPEGTIQLSLLIGLLLSIIAQLEVRKRLDQIPPIRSRFNRLLLQIEILVLDTTFMYFHNSLHQICEDGYSSSFMRDKNLFLNSETKRDSR